MLFKKKNKRISIDHHVLSFSSFRSSDEDDVEPIVVLKMQKPDPKGKGEFDNPIIREGVTHGSNDGSKEGNGLQKRTHDSEIKGHSGKRVEDKVATTGKARSQTLRALPTSRNVHFKHVINFAPATSNSFLCFEMDSIPVFGYTTFQQRDFSLLYFHFFKQHFQSESAGRPTKRPVYNELAGELEQRFLSILRGNTIDKNVGNVVESKML